MSTDFSAWRSEPKTCSQAVLGAPLMCYDSSENGDERLDVVSTTNPPGTLTNVPGSSIQDTGDMASPITIENSPRNVANKKRFQSFFRNSWKAIKSFHRRNKVGPCPNPADPKLVPAPPNPKAASKSHVADPEPLSGPSNLKAADELHLANPGSLSGPLNTKAVDELSRANPGPLRVPLNTKAVDELSRANPGPLRVPFNSKAEDELSLANSGSLSGPSNLKAAAEPCSVHPELGTSSHKINEHFPKQLKLSVTKENEGNGISAFFCRKWKAFKSIFSGKKGLSALYEAGKLIGGGASGAVYEGTRKSDGLKVAIKCVQCTPLDAEDMEIEVYVNLLLKETSPCPNIVQMFDWYQEPDRYLMVMEYPYPCVTLDRFIRQSGGTLSESVARGIIRQLIQAVNYCLNRGIVHYDLHFGNLLVNTDTMQVKVIDFGLANVLRTTACDPSSRFMLESPPEFRFEDFYTARWTTVYSLGRILLLMVNGYFGALKPGLSKEVGDLIDWCKQASKENRPTLEEMLQHDWFTKEELTYDQMH